VLIRRYLIREILAPFSAICAVLVLILAAYSGAHYLGDAVAGELPPAMVGQMVLLKILLTLELLVPVALYLSVVIGLGRLHHDHESVAMAAAGMGEGRLLGAVLWLALPTALVVGVLALQVRPWAYQQTYTLKARLEAEFDLGQLQAGRFLVSGESGYTVFSEALREREPLRLQGVFLQQREAGQTRLIVAREAERHDPAEDFPSLRFHDGMVYDLDLDGSADRSLRFRDLDVTLEGYRQVPIPQRRKATATAALAGSDDPEDIAEWQWRWSRPLLTVLLAALAVPLSRSRPRQGRHARTVLAVLACVVYFNLDSLARTLVERALIPPLPGLWWLAVLLLACVAVLMRPRALRGG